MKFGVPEDLSTSIPWINFNTDEMSFELTEEAQATRARWRQSLNEQTGANSIIGYDGENYIDVHVMAMQNGTAQILLVSGCADNPFGCSTATVAWRDVGVSLNRMLEDYLRDPLSAAA